MSAAETTLMDVVCWSNSSAATEEADRIWAETLQSGLDPSPKMYEMMILIFLSNDDADLAIKESEGFLNEMLKLGALPSQTVVIALIELYGSLGAPKRAEALIDRLTFAGMTISVQVYNTLMRAWGASSPMEAEEVFKRLQFANVQPDQETFMALIDGWSSSPRSDAPARCNDNLSKMTAYGLKAPIEVYEQVFRVWVQSGSARMTESLADLRRDMEGAGIAMSQSCYDSYAAAISLNEDRMKAPVLLDALVREIEMLSFDPTVTNMNLALALAKQRQSGAAERAEEVLWRLESRANDDGSPASSCDKQQAKEMGNIYEGIISAWTYENEAHRAELLLKRYMSHYAHTSSLDQTLSLWNTVLAAYSQGTEAGRGSRNGGATESGIEKSWAKSGEMVIAVGPRSATVEKGVQEDREGIDDGATPTLMVGPSTTNKLVNAALNAERLYHEMAEASQRYPEIAPNQWTYSSLISVWARAGFPEGAEYFRECMLSQGMQPTQFCYYALIEGWLEGLPRLPAESPASASSGVGSVRSENKSTLAPPEPIDLSNVEEQKRKWTISSRAEALRRISALFEAMCKEAVGSDQPAFYCQQAYSRIVDSWPLEQAEVFDTAFMEQEEEGEDADESSTEHGSLKNVFRCILNVLSEGRRDSIGALSEGGAAATADQALEVLQRMAARNMDPDLECYSSVVTALERAAVTPFGGTMNTNSFHSPLARAVGEKNHPNGGIGSPRSKGGGVRVKSRGLSTIPDRALEVVKQLIMSGIAPSTLIYESLLNIWLKSQRPDSPRVAESIFRSMVGRTPGPPTLRSFKLLLETYARSPLPNAAEKAEEVLETMKAAKVEPDAAVYSLIARAWSKSWRHSGAVLVVTDAQSGEVVRMDYLTRTTQAYRRCLEAGLKPDASMLRSLLSVYCRDRSARSLGAAEALLIDQALSAAPATLPGSQIGERPEYVHEQGVALLHPSVYSQMARAWQAVCDDKELLRQGESEEKEEADRGGAIAASRSFMEKLLRASRPTEHPQQLYVAWSLQLAALAEGALVSATTGVEAVGQAEDIFNMMMDSQIQYTKGMEGDGKGVREEQELARGFLQADTVTMNLVLEVVGCALMSRSMGISSVLEKCDAVLTKGALIGILPNTYTFQVMLKVWRDCNVSDLPSRAQALFDRILSAKASDSRPSSPSPSSAVMFSSLLEVWADANPRQATDILDRMLALGMSPLPASYAQLMKAWARVGNGEMCEEVLERMFNQDLIPDPASSRLLLSTLASSSSARVDSAERTENAMKKLLASGAKIDAYMLSSQLEAWAKSSSSLAIDKAEEALRRGVAGGVEAGTCHYNLLLDIAGKSNGAQAPERVEALFKEMLAANLEPDISTYNAVIAAWGRSPRAEAEQRALYFFDMAVSHESAKAAMAQAAAVHKSEKEAQKTDTISLALTDTGGAGAGAVSRRENVPVVPNVITYSSLLSALSNARDADAPTRANKIFQQMVRAGVRPDTMSWTILIGIWARSRAAGHEHEAQRIFERMLDENDSYQRPNAVTFTTLLTMWANSKLPEASDRVVEVFKHMTVMGVRLDTVGYSSLLSALGRSDDPDAPLRANEVFEQMLASGARPDTQCWTILISIWARSSLSGKEAECQAIYDRMVASRQAAPNAITYTAMLKLWYYSRDVDHAKKRINALYESILTDHVALDSGAFKWLLTSLGKACTSAESYSKVELLLSRMIAFGITPDAATWRTVLGSTVVRLSLERVMKVFRLMKQAGVSLDGSVIDSLISALTDSPLTAQQKNSRMLIKCLRVLLLDPAVKLSKSHTAKILENLSRNVHGQVVAGVVTKILRELLISTRYAPMLPPRASVDVARAYARQNMAGALAEPTPPLPSCEALDSSPQARRWHAGIVEYVNNELVRWAERDFNRVPLLAERDAAIAWATVQEMNPDAATFCTPYSDNDNFGDDESVVNQMSRMYSTTPVIAYMMTVWRRSRAKDGLPHIVGGMQDYAAARIEAVAQGNTAEAGLWLEEDALHAFKECFAMFSNTIGVHTKGILAESDGSAESPPIVVPEEEGRNTARKVLLETPHTQALLAFFAEHARFEERISLLMAERKLKIAASVGGEGGRQYRRGAPRDRDKGEANAADKRLHRLRQQTFEYKLSILDDIASHGTSLLSEACLALFEREHLGLLMSTLASARIFGLSLDEGGRHKAYLSSMLLDTTDENEGEKQSPLLSLPALRGLVFASAARSGLSRGTPVRYIKGSGKKKSPPGKSSEEEKR